MSFSSYRNLSSVVQEFQITYQHKKFIQELPFSVSDYFRQDLEIMMEDGVVDNSEYAICENLIYPVLKDVWKNYRDKFLLWSHQSLNYSNDLSGFPEYILAKRSPLGTIIFDKPYLLLVEAKQDKFEEGWAQCLVEMIAAQRLNGELDVTVFGIASNGKMWEFGQLEKDLFTKNTIAYTIYNLEQLFAVINYVFAQCELQLKRKELLVEQI